MLIFYPVLLDQYLFPPHNKTCLKHFSEFLIESSNPGRVVGECHGNLFKEEVFRGEVVVASLCLHVSVVGKKLQVGQPLNEDMFILKNHVIKCVLRVDLRSHVRHAHDLSHRMLDTLGVHFIEGGFLGILEKKDNGY